MKKIILIILLSASVFISSAQSYSVDLQVANVAEMDFAPFILSNDLSGAPRIFSVTISPEEGNVRVRGEVFWKQNENSDFEWLLTFRTKLFTARSFFNTDLGNSIPLGRNNSDSELIEQNRKRGKPTGQYRIDLYLLDENGNQLAFDSELLSFSNPAQTLSIRLPQSGSLQNIGGVLAEWDALDGIEYYQVLANVRGEKAQSLEDALTSGEPVIDNVKVGQANSIDLRSILTREWLPGQEIVLQVSAMPVGGTLSDLIESNIVYFYLDDPSNPANDAASQEMMDLLESLEDQLGSDLLESLMNGEGKIIEIIDEETGIPLSPQEMQELLDYWRRNPDNLINVEHD